MSDSLREQLLKAGFKARDQAPASKPRRRRKGGAATNVPARGARRRNDASGGVETDPKILEKRALKQKIRALINTHRVEQATGDEVYRYLQGTRIREIRVTEAVRERIVTGELAITRLDGNTLVIPAEVVPELLALNPAWAVARVTDDRDAPASGPEEQAGSGQDADDDYAAYVVPDDLRW